MHSITSETFAVYKSNSVKFKFKEQIEGKEQRVFVKVICKGTDSKKYSVDISQDANFIPLEVPFTDPVQKIQWLLKNQYFPSIVATEEKVVFSLDNEQLVVVDETTSLIVKPYQQKEQSTTDNKEKIRLEKLYTKLQNARTNKVNESEAKYIQKIKDHYTNNYLEKEKGLHEGLLQSKRDKDILSQITFLVELSELYAAEGKWQKAANALNAALVISNTFDQENNVFFKKNLLERMERIEICFLNFLGCTKVFYEPQAQIADYLSNRSDLNDIRQNHATQLSDVKQVQIATQKLAESYQKFLAKIIQKAQNLLGKPPTEWACVALGEMANQETSLYPNLKFAFLINQKTPEALAYFRTLFQLIELKIINLGETEYPLFATIFGRNNNETSPTPKGLSIDSIDHSSGGFELITTPEALAQYVSGQWKRGDPSIASTLSSVCHITGNQALVKRYKSLSEGELMEKDGWLFWGTPFHEKYALKLLGHQLPVIESILFKKEAQRKEDFNLKRELYDPFRLCLENLKLFYCLESNSSFAIIQELRKKNILSPKGASNLTGALQKLLVLRFEVQALHQHDKESLYREEGTQDYWNRIEEIYKVLIPFYRCMAQFAAQQNPKALQGSFYDNSEGLQAIICSHTFQYEKAKNLYGQALQKNDKDAELHWGLSLVENELGESKEASKSLKKVIDSIERKNKKDPSLITHYIQLGGIYQTLKDYKEARRCYKAALNVQSESGFKKISDQLLVYHSIGNTYSEEGNHIKAAKCYNEALAVQGETLDGLSIAQSHYSLALTYAHCQQWAFALEHCQTSMIMQIGILGEEHPDMAFIYDQLGHILMNLEKWDGALFYCKKALAINGKVEEGNECAIIDNYLKIASCCQRLEERDEALQSYQKALGLQLKIDGEQAPSVARGCSQIGVLYGDRKEFKKAIKSFEKAIEIALNGNRELVGEMLQGIMDVMSKMPFSDELLGILEIIDSSCRTKLGTETLRPFEEAIKSYKERISETEGV